MKNSDYTPLKFRPKTFDAIIGNEGVVESLKSIMKRKKGIPSCFLFVGPPGCGKTTLGRIVAKELGCADVNLREYNISQMRGIDTARDIINDARFNPIGGGAKVFVLNEIHKATSEFQNSMLEVLEEPPEGVYFILCTTEPEKLIKPIRGNQRGMTFKVSQLSSQLILKLLKRVVKKAGIEINESLLRKISVNCDGTPRIALTVLDQVSGVKKGKAIEIINDAGSYIEADAEVIDLCRVLIGPGNAQGKWRDCSALIRDLKADPEAARRAIKGYMASVLINKGNDKVCEMLGLFLQPFYDGGREQFIEAVYLACKV